MPYDGRTTPREIQTFYHSKRWHRAKNYVFIRDAGLCQHCGGIGTEVHHKVPVTLDNYKEAIAVDPDNLITLCTACHRSHHNMESTGGLNNKYVRNDLVFNAEGDLVERYPPLSTTKL